jgi:hypothetical protein
MQQRNAVGREDVSGEVVGHLGGGAQIHLLGLFDQRVDHVRLPPLVQLLADEVVDLVAPRFRFRDRLDRIASRRHLAHHRDIEIAVGGEGQCPRDRRRRHHQDVGMLPLLAQVRPLHDAEPVLLVDHHQPELAKAHRILDQGMGADDEVERSARELRLDLAPLLRRGRAGQHRDAEPR